MTAPHEDLLPDWAWPVDDSVAAQAMPRPVDAGPFRTADALSWCAAEPGTGLRLAVKENIAVAGRPLRAGTPSRDAEPPQQRDAPVVTALRAAGMSLVGTTRMHELAFGVTGRNDGDGTVANPVDPARLPGGSSSGSAVAVATRAVDVALGTDTGGSARIPAALCGVVGYKASRLVPALGVLPLSPSLDHLGWFGRDVATARRVADVVGIPATPAPTRPRLAVVRALVEGADAEVGAAFDRALSLIAAHADVAEVDWLHLDLTAAVSTTVMFAEAAHWHGARAADHGRDVRTRLERGGTVSRAAYLTGLGLTRWLSARWAELTEGFDAVLAPTCASVAPPIGAAGDPRVSVGLIRTTRLDDLTGLPALSLPLTSTGLPVGLHVGARTDAGLLAVAASIESWLR